MAVQFEHTKQSHPEQAYRMPGHDCGCTPSVESGVVSRTADEFKPKLEAQLVQLQHFDESCLKCRSSEMADPAGVSRDELRIEAGRLEQLIRIYFWMASGYQRISIVVRAQSIDIGESALAHEQFGLLAGDSAHDQFFDAYRRASQHLQQVREALDLRLTRQRIRNIWSILYQAEFEIAKFAHVVFATNDALCALEFSNKDRSDRLARAMNTGCSSPRRSVRLSERQEQILEARQQRLFRWSRKRATIRMRRSLHPKYSYDAPNIRRKQQHQHMSYSRWVANRKFPQDMLATQLPDHVQIWKFCRPNKELDVPDPAGSLGSLFTPDQIRGAFPRGHALASPKTVSWR